MAATGDPRLRRLAPTEGGRTPTLVVTLVAIGVLVALGVLVRSTQEQDPPSRLVVLFAYSALDDVLSDGVLPAFQTRWREAKGEDVEFVTTFGGSRALTNRILREVPVQIAILTSELDAQRLVPRTVRPGAWQDLPHRGVLARTPLVIRVREGNPHGIGGFEDLARTDLGVVRPDPATSGLGECVLLAAYGARMRTDRNRRDALDLVLTLQGAQPAPTRTAREAARRFRAGEGDVCLAYEHDVVETPSRPRPQGDVVRTRFTLICEPVVVVIHRNVAAEDRPVIRGFTEFLWSAEGQAILQAYGFHGPRTGAGDLGIEDAFTIADLEDPEGVLDAAVATMPSRE